MLLLVGFGLWLPDIKCPIPVLGAARLVGNPTCAFQCSLGSVINLRTEKPGTNPERNWSHWKIQVACWRSLGPLLETFTWFDPRPGP